MAHARVKDILLGVVDRQIREAEEGARESFARSDWAEFAALKAHAERMTKLRGELAKVISSLLGCR